MYSIKYISAIEAAERGTFQDAVWLLFAETVA